MINPMKKAFELPETFMDNKINMEKMNGPNAATPAVQPITPAA